MVKIGRLRKSDIPGFCKLLLKIFDEGFSYYPKKAQIYNKKYWSQERLSDYLFKNSRLLLIAKDGQRPVGYLIGKYYSSGNSSILWLGVLPEFRGKGVGGRLVRFWEKWAVKKGAKRLRTSTANFDNERFYTNLGFAKLPVMERNDWGMKKLVFIKKENHG